MKIKSIPEDFDEYERYNVEYEREYFSYTDTNRRVGIATREMFLDWFLPSPLHFLGEPFVYAMMDDSLLESFGFPKPPQAVRSLVEGALKLRARTMRYLPERQRPRLRTQMKHRTYQHGYQIEKLGPPV